MYYTVSSNSIKAGGADKSLIKVIDREIAHAYNPGKRGYVEESLLVSKTGLSSSVVRQAMREYQQSQVVQPYKQVEHCGESQDPADGNCSECSRPLAGAPLTGVNCYRVIVQPQKPAFDPTLQPQQPKVMISYRRLDTEPLATDLYYALILEQISVFLDTGDIPVGAMAEDVFLRAASTADHFIVLVSLNYFGSLYCKKEIAHAARAGKRIIRVNVPPVPPAPADIPWVNNPNWVSQNGAGRGLDSALERSLFTAIKTPNTPGSIADLRREGCQFLMEQMTPNELLGIWNRLPWMVGFKPSNSKQEDIRLILSEAGGARLDVLCNALAP